MFLFELLFGKLRPIEELGNQLRDRREHPRDELCNFLDKAFGIRQPDEPLFVYAPNPSEDCRYNNEIKGPQTHYFESLLTTDRKRCNLYEIKQKNVTSTTPSP